MNKNFRDKTRAVTLVEVAITVAVLGIAAYIIPITLKLLNGLRYQQEMAHVNQRVESFVIILSRDIYNAPKFWDGGVPFVAGALNTMQLKLFTLNNQDFDLNMHVFDALKPNTQPLAAAEGYWGELQYFYTNVGGVRKITRNLYFRPPGKPERRETKDFLAGIIVDPGGAGHPLFSFATDSAGHMKKDSIMVDISFRYPFQRPTDPPKRFRKEMLRWSNFDLKLE